MFTRPRALVAVGLLVLMCAFGVAAVVSTPDAGRGIGIWPVALATAKSGSLQRARACIALIRSTRRRSPPPRNRSSLPVNRKPARNNGIM